MPINWAGVSTSWHLQTTCVSHSPVANSLPISAVPQSARCCRQRSDWKLDFALFAMTGARRDGMSGRWLRLIVLILHPMKVLYTQVQWAILSLATRPFMSVDSSRAHTMGAPLPPDAISWQPVHMLSLNVTEISVGTDWPPYSTGTSLT